MISKNILITGGTGLVGTALTAMLQARGHRVTHLVRAHRKNETVKTFLWNVEAQTIEPNAFDYIDTIIHLAGAGVADKRWTDARKKEILESRTHSTQLLYKTLNEVRHSVTAFISASAIGYYGFPDTEETFTENTLPGNDFLARVTRAWEAEADRLEELMRLVKIRIGIVLSEKGGTLKEIARPVNYFVGAPLGSGDQYVSWIHIQDLCNIFIRAVEDNTLHGAYNAVSLTPATNRSLTQAIAKAIGKPLWLPAVPAFALRLVLGEMADIVVKGSKVSSSKIRAAGFQFAFDDLDSALRDLYSKK